MNKKKPIRKRRPAPAAVIKELENFQSTWEWQRLFEQLELFNRSLDLMKPWCYFFDHPKAGQLICIYEPNVAIGELHQSLRDMLVPGRNEIFRAAEKRGLLKIKRRFTDEEVESVRYEDGSPWTEDDKEELRRETENDYGAGPGTADENIQAINKFGLEMRIERQTLVLSFWREIRERLLNHFEQAVNTTLSNIGDEILCQVIPHLLSQTNSPELNTELKRYRSKFITRAEGERRLAVGLLSRGGDQKKNSRDYARPSPEQISQIKQTAKQYLPRWKAAKKLARREIKGKRQVDWLKTLEGQYSDLPSDILRLLKVWTATQCASEHAWRLHEFPANYYKPSSLKTKLTRRKALAHHQRGGSKRGDSKIRSSPKHNQSG